MAIIASAAQPANSRAQPQPARAGAESDAMVFATQSASLNPNTTKTLMVSTDVVPSNDERVYKKPEQQQHGIYGRAIAHLCLTPL